MSENRYGQFDRQRIQENRKKASRQPRQAGYARAASRPPVEMPAEAPEEKLSANPM